MINKSIFCLMIALSFQPVHASDSPIQMAITEAQNGDLSAQLYVATKYYKGDVLDKNYGKAFEWYLRAAEQGDDRAQFFVASMYLDGEGVAKDLARAKYWFMKSGAQENEAALAQLGYKWDNIDKDKKDKLKQNIAKFLKILVEHQEDIEKIENEYQKKVAAIKNNYNTRVAAIERYQEVT